MYRTVCDTIRLIRVSLVLIIIRRGILNLRVPVLAGGALGALGLRPLAPAAGDPLPAADTGACEKSAPHTRVALPP